METIKLKNFEKKCTGCFACYNICPQQAIEMKLNEEGFFYPVVDEEKCIHCGLCDKVCFLNETEEKNVPENAIIIKGEDEIRKKCSSGGAFYYIAKSILDVGGVVYGAVYDKQSHMVVHTSTKEVPLEDTLRSKYVQSYIGNTYIHIKKDLLNNKKVCFCGTPCQVYGLKKYLKRDYDNLSTIDFVCHGVPSTGLFKDVLNKYEIQEKSKISNITFREKDLGWRNQQIKIYFENGKILRIKSKNSFYYQLFIDNITLRQSCYNCKLASAHKSDITLLDFWSSTEDDDLGLSAACVNSQIGEKTINSISNGAIASNVSNEVNRKCFINHSEVKSYKNALNDRNKFFGLYLKFGLNDKINKWYLKHCNKKKLRSKTNKFLLKGRDALYKILGKR